MRSLLLACLLLFTLPAQADPVPPVARVFVVVLENTDVALALAQPNLAALARRGALLADARAVARPSQPNYLALIGGSTFGVTSNSPVTLEGEHLGNLLEARGKEWKSYTEDYPGNCFLGAAYDDYVRKHQPFISFRNVQESAARCARVVPAEQLDADLAAGRLPDFALYVPNEKNDGHDTGVAFADGWFGRRFGALLEEPRFMQGTLFVVTFDEAGASRENRIYTVLLGDTVKPGARAEATYNHYSLLRTIELALGLGDLGRQDATAAPIAEVWRER